MTESRTLPSNFGPLKGAQANARILGPCGDTMEFWLAVRNGRIVRATFTTDGCGASIASGALAAHLAEGRTVEEARRLEAAEVAACLPELPEDHRHCPVLAVNTLRAALERCPVQEPEEASAEAADPGPSEPGPAPLAPALPGHAPNEAKQEAVRQRLSRVGLTVVVLSGKGGVGKSTVAVNLAVALAAAGKSVGLLDVDLHGPSVPLLLGLTERPTTDPTGQALLPIVSREGVKVMSIGLILQDARDAIIWRGPMKHNAIQEMLGGVAWGDLDVLVIDAPPGTGDEPLAVAQAIGRPAGAIVVTTPQRVAVADVRRSLTFCEQAKLRVLGIVENMSAYTCPECGQTQSLFKQGGGRALAEEMKVPFLGSLPLDPGVVDSGDRGTPFVAAAPDSPAARAFRELIVPILNEMKPQNEPSHPTAAGNGTVKLAVPLAGGRLSEHFGHCEQFALIEVNTTAKTIVRQTLAAPPPHEPGVLPRWLHEQGVLAIVAGGMGQRALSLFHQYGITVVAGVPGQTAEAMAQAYLAGQLKSSVAGCNHHGGCTH